MTFRFNEFSTRKLFLAWVLNRKQTVNVGFAGIEISVEVPVNDTSFMCNVAR